MLDREKRIEAATPIIENLNELEREIPEYRKKIDAFMVGEITHEEVEEWIENETEYIKHL